MKQLTSSEIEKVSGGIPVPIALVAWAAGRWAIANVPRIAIPVGMLGGAAAYREHR